MPGSRSGRAMAFRFSSQARNRARVLQSIESSGTGPACKNMPPAVSSWSGSDPHSNARFAEGMFDSNDGRIKVNKGPRTGITDTPHPLDSAPNLASFSYTSNYEY